jgi:hypothetical protein
MRDDRWPRAHVVIDEENAAEEMEVHASFRELAPIVALNHPHANLADAVDAEPWVRVRHGDDIYLSCDVTLIPDEDDGA